MITEARVHYSWKVSLKNSSVCYKMNVFEFPTMLDYEH